VLSTGAGSVNWSGRLETPQFPVRLQTGACTCGAQGLGLDQTCQVLVGSFTSTRHVQVHGTCRTEKLRVQTKLRFTTIVTGIVALGTLDGVPFRRDTNEQGIPPIQLAKRNHRRMPCTLHRLGNMQSNAVARRTQFSSCDECRRSRVGCDALSRSNETGDSSASCTRCLNRNQQCTFKACRQSRMKPRRQSWLTSISG
jgi:hypothetical protein